MFGFLSFLLILFLLIIFIGFSILGNIMRVLFGGGNNAAIIKAIHTPTTKISTDSKMPMTAMLKPTQLQTHITSQKAIKRRYSVMTKENMLILRNNNSSPISGYHRLFLKKSFIN